MILNALLYLIPAALYYKVLSTLKDSLLPGIGDVASN
jgi:hypothetical protein